MFEQALNWKLLHGSHTFPGPDGGTCINEAAVVAAGFEYRKVNSTTDLPDCFSPVLSDLAMFINDALSDDELRTKLLTPWIMRLAGTADEPRIEEARRELIWQVAAQKMLDQLEKTQKLTVFGAIQRFLGRPTAVDTLVEKWRERARQNLLSDWAGMTTECGDNFMQLNTSWIVNLEVFALFELAKRKKGLPYDTLLFLAGNGPDYLLEMLEQVAAIGKQPDPLDQSLIQQRFDNIRKLAKQPISA